MKIKFSLDSNMGFGRRKRQTEVPTAPIQQQPAMTAQPEFYNDAALARSQRRKAFKSAIISYQEFSITIECLLRDMSDTGVKLQIEDGQLVPDHFHLTVPVDGIRVECMVRWRNGNQLGASFEGEVETDQRNARKQSVAAEYVAPRKVSILRKQR